MQFKDRLEVHVLEYYLHFLVPHLYLQLPLHTGLLDDNPSLRTTLQVLSELKLERHFRK